jgi:hypothetical protein
MEIIKTAGKVILGAAWLAFGSAAVVAEESIEQVIDSIYFSGPTVAAELPFGDPTRRAPLPEYIDRGIGGTALRGCALTPIDGLYCLDLRGDGKFVRNWPNPARVQELPPLDPFVPGFDIINCDDVPGLDARRDDTCTTFTVDLGGTLWIGGKERGKAYSLVEAIEIPVADTCPGGYDALPVLSPNGSRYCSRMVASGRPLLVDIDAVDGDVAAKFSLFGSGPLSGLLLLEERKTATFTEFDGTTTLIATGKRGWGLIGAEQLLGIALLQIAADTVEDTQNYVLATTTSGRVLAYDTAGTGAAFEVFDIPASREAATLAAGPCNALEARYGVRASAETGFVYVTDSGYCEVLALQPAVDGSGAFASLVNAIEAGANLTLSTRISAGE